MLLHFWFEWSEWLRDGYLDQAQARYYYALWPGFALALALLWPLHKGPARTVIASVTGASLVMSSAAFCIPLALVAGSGPLR
jgi:hypothetical protein